MANGQYKLLVLAAFAVSLFLVGAGLFNAARGEEASSGPLVVPVFPKMRAPAELPEGADLRDSYIVLEDGSVLSVADWILGAIGRDPVTGNLSDYENRLFLGQVARRLAGIDERMVNRLPVLSPSVGLSAPQQASLSLGPLSLGEKPVGPNPLTLSGAGRGLYALNDSIGTDRPDEISLGKLALSENPYETAFARSVEDFKIMGIVRNMLKDQ